MEIMKYTFSRGNFSLWNIQVQKNMLEVKGFFQQVGGGFFMKIKKKEKKIEIKEEGEKKGEIII